MHDDLTTKISFRENLSNIKNLISYIYKIDKYSYFLPALRILLNTINSAVSLVLTADILEMLYQGNPIKEIARPVILLLALTFLLNMAASVLQEEFINPRRTNVKRIYDGNLAAKFQQMDYSLVDSPYVKKLQERIEKDNNWGSGLNNLFWDFDAIVKGICNFFCSLIIALPLLKIIIASQSWLMYLGLVLLILLLYLLTRNAAKAEAAFTQLLLNDYLEQYPLEMQKEYTSLIWVWLSRCLGGEYEFIKDIHLYDGLDLMNKYTSENRREQEKVMPWAAARGKLSGRQGLLEGVTGSFIILAGYLISAGYALIGAFPIGSTIKFAGSISNIMESLQSIDSNYRSLSLTARKQASTLEMLNICDEMYKGKLPVEKRMDHKYEIEFRNVSFQYPGTQGYALKNLSLKLRIGERMAIVGMNGSGKTTMIKLLCRLYDPQEGEILLNGVDIRKFAQDEYIKLFSVVFQDFKLLSLPLGQNVASSTEVDTTLAAETLRQAGLTKRLQQLPKGLNTFLYQDIMDDGVEISGGEAQKIAIARALYKDAPFVLLDEPTASLDPLSEYEIYSGFDAMVGNKTAIYISHRLSSCRFCNDIAVFHEGSLVQRGSHEELLRDEKGKYYELWNAQAQYYT